MNFSAFFAGISPQGLLAEPRSMSPGMGRLMFTLCLAGVSVAAMGALASWLYRKRKRQHRHRSHRHSDSPGASETTDAQAQVENVMEHHLKRHRKRRREHRPRNPTLAETGGLPPVRTEEPPGPTL